MRKHNAMHYGLALTLLVVAPLALAFIDPTADEIRGTKNFDPQASLSPDGRTITLLGAVGPCEVREETSEVQAQVTQETTFAAANATTIRPCSVVHPMRFVIRATVDAAKPAFVAGPVKVCGTGLSRAGTQIIDIETWCTYVNLVNQ